MSAEALRTFTKNLLKAPGAYERLSQRLSTASAWQTASEEDVEALLGNEPELASAVIRRVRENLS
jgi:hypothetical protein